jgi:multiple sugar transport system substrate-binding protein
MKRIGVLMLVLVVSVLPLFAAGRQGQSSGGAAASGKTEIRAAWWGDTIRHELYNNIVDEFQKVNPDVLVIREPTSWNDYWDKLSVQAAGGNAPDFIGMHPQYAADYIPRGVCEPLDSYIADRTLSTDGWSQGTIDTGKFDGKVYMMAMGVTFSSAFVNTGIFKELGVTPPAFDWTWDDVRRIGLQVRTAFDRQGKRTSWLLNDISTNLNSWRYFVRQHGREVYDARGNISFQISDAEEWFTMFKEFRDLGIIPDAATATEYFNATLEDSLFSRDKILVLWIPINQYKLYCTTFPNKEVSFIRMATAPGRPAGEWPEGAHFAVNARSTPEKKRAAVRLMNFWLNDERSLKIYGLDQGVPGNLKVGEVIIPTLDQYQLKIVEFVNTLSGIGTPTIYPPTGASEIDALFRNFAEQVQFNRKTPAAAAKEFYDQAVTIRTNANQ